MNKIMDLTIDKFDIESEKEFLAEQEKNIEEELEAYNNTHSNCCDAIINELGLCSDCKEHCK